MNLKDGKTANDVAALAETLADRIEATTERDKPLNHEIAALLLPGDFRVHLARRDGLMLDAKGNPATVPSPWGGSTRGALRSDFAKDVGLVIALAETVFAGWGWDIIKWPRGQGGIPAGLAKLDEAGVPEPLPEGAFVYDAEVTPTEEFGNTVAGRSLIGQHTTAGGALLAAILRGYAYKVKHEAGTLAPPIDFGLTDQERGFVEDIVDRAEDLELSPKAARVDRMMDIAAVHKNGCPLDLESFLHHATDFAFKHDFLGIVENVDRSTGKLKSDWQPKYSQAETDRIVAGVGAGKPAGDYTAIVSGSVDEQGKFTVDAVETIEPKSED